MALKLHPAVRVHPGDWLKTEIIDAHGMKMTEAADRLGVSRQALSRLVNGHYGLSAEMAIRFEKLFGVKADTMMRMQTAYDLAQARDHEKDIVVRELEAA
jgi:addiction module HigA family antidote